MWVVVFGLLVNLTGYHTCESSWYYNYWGWYWSRVWLTPDNVVGSASCAHWRTILAFSCINWVLFLISSFVVSSTHHQILNATLTPRQGLYMFLARPKTDINGETHHRR
jgi:hypothetical protein